MIDTKIQHNQQLNDSIGLDQINPNSGIPSDDRENTSLGSIIV